LANLTGSQTAAAGQSEEREVQSRVLRPPLVY
jgi:hypothetical protein